ncbi:MAG TPA: VIT1/CCC1 transporter family protein [Thermohalobaculum sp.]|nr:VIT1/CCC1 transporter family protein [Thermohalobaculum sp.]
MSSFSKEFREHLKTEHNLGRMSEFLREIVYGGNDGIVTTFAVVAGFAGAGAKGAAVVGGIAVLLFGLANLFADATSMALGAFLSARSEADIYRSARARELDEIHRNPDLERAELVEILRTKNVPDPDIAAFADLYGRNPELLADFMMQNEIGMSDPTGGNPAQDALATFLAFLFFGAIPLIPYFLMEPDRATFHWSVFATFAALVLLGLLRWRVTAETAIRCVAETVAVGGICAAIAYLVGMLVSA